MRHIKEITIDKFRGIEGLILKELGDINLIVGDNNVGKTSILEAVRSFMSYSPYGGTDKNISLS